jgi:hypothetical protein
MMISRLFASNPPVTVRAFLVTDPEASVSSLPVHQSEITKPL